MESRKRQHIDDGEPLLAKKRVLTSPDGSPHVNGVIAEPDEPTDGDNLEVLELTSCVLSIKIMLIRCSSFVKKPSFGE